MRDPLTQLATRRRFSAFLAEEWQRSVSDGSPIALCLIDVDHLAALNERAGREAGDACLAHIARVLQDRVRRPTDLVARVADDEFAVVLVGAEETGAMAVAEWLRAQVERQEIPHGASPIHDHVTLSVGVAVAIPRADVACDRLVADATGALRCAKELGRNAVIASSSSDGII